MYEYMIVFLLKIIPKNLILKWCCFSWEFQLFIDPAPCLLENDQLPCFSLVPWESALLFVCFNRLIICLLSPFLVLFHCLGLLLLCLRGEAKILALLTVGEQSCS